MLVVVIDDERRFDPEVASPARAAAEYYVTSTDGFRRILKAVEDDEVIEELWLDHDLGPGDDTYAFALMMEEDAVQFTPWPVKRVMIHTANPSASERLRKALARHYNVRTVKYPEAEGLIKGDA